MSIINSFKVMNKKLACLDNKSINEVIGKQDFIVINDLNSVSSLLDKSDYWSKLNEKLSIRVKFSRRISNNSLLLVDRIARKMLRASTLFYDSLLIKNYYSEFGVSIESS